MGTHPSSADGRIESGDTGIRGARLPVEHSEPPRNRTENSQIESRFERLK